MFSILINSQFRQLVAMGFSTLFFLFALFLAGLMFHEIIDGFLHADKLIGVFVNAINTAVIALATFELGTVVSQEYGNNDEGHIVVVLRRTLPRFISIVSIALALEGLLMVIKYSQLELAGNLYYPVAIIIATSMLITSLGVFLRFTSFTVEEGLQAGTGESDNTASSRSCVPFCQTSKQYTGMQNIENKTTTNTSVHPVRR